MTLRGAVRFAGELPRAAYWLVRIELGLRRHELPVLCRKLGIAVDLTSAAPPATEHAVLPRNARAAVLASMFAVALWPAGNTCLRRCLVLGRRLRSLHPVLRIGVRRDEKGAFIAHSWLEIDGRTLDDEAGRYATLGTVTR